MRLGTGRGSPGRLPWPGPWCRRRPLRPLARCSGRPRRPADAAHPLRPAGVDGQDTGVRVGRAEDCAVQVLGLAKVCRVEYATRSPIVPVECAGGLSYGHDAAPAAGAGPALLSAARRSAVTHTASTIAW